MAVRTRGHRQTSFYSCKWLPLALSDAPRLPNWYILQFFNVPHFLPLLLKSRVGTRSNFSVHLWALPLTSCYCYHPLKPHNITRKRTLNIITTGHIYIRVSECRTSMSYTACHWNITLDTLFFLYYLNIIIFTRLNLLYKTIFTFEYIAR